MLLHVFAQAETLAAATLASEDLALVGAAVLIQQHELGLWTGLGGVGIGILAGDVGLWLVGRLLAGRLLRVPAIARRVPPERLEAAKATLEARLPAAVLASRFLPGSRLPLHLAAGSLGRGGIRYAFWTLVAVALWVPLVVGVVVIGGGRAADTLHAWLGTGWLATAAAALPALVMLRLLARSSRGRRG